MATKKTIPNPLPPGADQLDGVKQVTRAMEDYSYQVMTPRPRTTASGPGRAKANSSLQISGPRSCYATERGLADLGG